MKIDSTLKSLMPDPDERLPVVVQFRIDGHYDPHCNGSAGNPDITIEAIYPRSRDLDLMPYLSSKQVERQYHRVCRTLVDAFQSPRAA